MFVASDQIQHTTSQYTRCDLFLQPEQRRNVPGDYSEKTAQVIDEELRNIIDQQYKVAMKLLDKKRDIMEEAVTELMEKE